MENGKEERRGKKRSYIEPYDTETFLEFRLEGKKYRFKLLDTSPGGVGMLITKEDEEVVKKLKIGDRRKMKYATPEGSLYMDFELMHITPINRGRYEGHLQVGLAISDKYRL